MIHIQAFAIVQEFSYKFFSKINTEMTLRCLRTSNIVERDVPAILVSFLAAFQAFAIVQEFSYNFFSKINTEMTLRGLRTSNIVERDVAPFWFHF